MNIKFIPLLLYTLAIASLSSCRQDDGTQVRNVRFDPSLINQAMDGTPCVSYSYVYQDQQKNLGTAYTKQIVVAFADGSTYEQQKSAVEKYGFVRGIAGQTSSNSSMLYTLNLMDGLNCKQAEQAIRVLQNDKLVSYAAPYFVSDNNLLGVSNEAIVTMRNGNSAALKQLLQDYNATLVSIIADGVFVVKVDKNSNGNALEFTNYLNGKDGVAHAEPDFIVSLATGKQVTEGNGKRAEFTDIP